MPKRERDTRHSRLSPSNYCFGCGPDNPDGMKLKFLFDEEAHRVTCHVRSLPRRFTGPPRHCHGGIIAVLLDEVMAKLNKLHGITAVTSQITVNYLRPVPLHQPLFMQSHEVKVEGRSRNRAAELCNKKGEVLARGQGIFITINPEKLFARATE